MADKNVELDPRIELTGFRDIDESSMEIIKKNILHHIHRIEELARKFERLHITLKSVHEREKSEKCDIHAKLNDGGKAYNTHVTERNIFVAIDSALEKLTNELD